MKLHRIVFLHFYAFSIFFSKLRDLNISSPIIYDSQSWANLGLGVAQTTLAGPCSHIANGSG